jgi:hypothetical protein
MPGLRNVKVPTSKAQASRASVFDRVFKFTRAGFEPAAQGVFHGLRTAHVQRYLDEFVFRWNRRRHTRIALDRLLGIGMGVAPATYRDFVDQRI